MVKRLAFLAILSAGAVAFWTGMARTEDAATGQDVDACEPDIHRLCDTYYPDAKLVAGCLIEKRSQLSVACAEALARPSDPIESGKPDDDKTDTGKIETGKTDTGKTDTRKTDTGKTDTGMGSPGADKAEADKK